MAQDSVPVLANVPVETIGAVNFFELDSVVAIASVKVV